MNAAEVLRNVEKLLAENKKSWPISQVYRDLEIFDWWVDTLSRAKLEQMRDFLTVAIALGYKGCPSFKVGSAGFSHGMWANRVPGPNENPEREEVLYHSFCPGENFYMVGWSDNDWTGELHGVKEVMKALVQHEVDNLIRR